LADGTEPCLCAGCRFRLRPLCELARRATTLITAAPKLRSKDADRTLAILLSEDAQPAVAGKTSDRSSRRLFERLVTLDAARELTGRPTFRLYGL
jgi:hypothetical protein